MSSNLFVLIYLGVIILIGYMVGGAAGVGVFLLLLVALVVVVALGWRNQVTRPPYDYSRRR